MSQVHSPPPPFSMNISLILRIFWPCRLSSLLPDKAAHASSWIPNDRMQAFSPLCPTRMWISSSLWNSMTELTMVPRDELTPPEPSPPPAPFAMTLWRQSCQWTGNRVRENVQFTCNILRWELSIFVRLCTATCPILWCDSCCLWRCTTSRNRQVMDRNCLSHRMSTTRKLWGCK